ncbi:MAG TPA: TolC family protein, partial [Candidatus Baltobacteraceae bacterium]|nr:TolC family protein [Candidatus Baltobacteraceae bacterium]
AGVPPTVSLDQAVAIAVMRSPVFASERAQYQAIYAKYGAEKSALFPNLSATGSITRSYGSSGNSGATPAPGASNVIVTSENGRLNLTQLIFDGGRVIAAIRSAKESDIAGKDTLLRNLQTLAFNVATAYYGLLQAQATVTADNAIVRQNETQESYVQAQIRAGSAARSDLAAAQFATAQARGALITAQGQVIAAEGTFSTTLGLDADTAVNPQVETSPTQVKALAYPDALSLALQLRPDYLAAQHNVTSAFQNVRFAKLARFPSVNANASTGTARTLIQTPAFSTPYTATSSIGATVTIPLYDQGLTNYNVATAVSQLDQANANLLQTKQTVESNVRGALAVLISARAGFLQAQAELQSAQVNAQATSARYRVGAASITDITTADANLATARRDYVAAQYTERLDEANYTYALGNADLSLP